VDRPNATPVPLHQRAVGLAIHAFTASGAVIGAAALVAVAEGRAQLAALLMLAALAVDAFDGTLARRADVVRTVPWIDGRRLDDVVDYVNYVVVPIVFLVLVGRLPAGIAGWAAAACPVVASAFGFSNQRAKTPDHFFLGFPSYWNVVALYLWLFDFAPGWNAALLVTLAIGVFVPLRYLYPTRAPRWRLTSLTLGGVWFAALFIAVAVRGETWSQPVAVVSLFYPLYYLIASAILGGHRRLEG